MKRHHHLFFILFILGETLSIGRISAKEQTTLSQKEFTEHIQNICFTQPDSAIRLVKQAETQGIYPSAYLDYLRCLVYHNGFGMYNTALHYGEKALRNQASIQQPKELLSLYDIMMEDHRIGGKYDKSLQCALKGLKIARQLKDKSMEGNMILSMGVIKWEMGLKEEAERHFRQAMDILKEASRKSTEWEIVDNLIFCYGTIISCAWQSEKYQLAIDLLPVYEETMKQLEQCTDLPEGIADMRYASEYACYASVFTKNGDTETGKRYYRKFLQTDYASTSEGESLRTEYLLAAGRYKEALKYIRKEKTAVIAQTDTISQDYIEYVLKPEALACEQLGDKSGAIQAYREIITLSDSLKSRERRNITLELATIYELNEKEAQLQQQSSDLNMRNRTIILLTISLFLLILFLRRIIVHTRTIRNKNKLMVRRIEELYCCEDKLRETQAELSRLQLQQEHVAQQEALPNVPLDNKENTHEEIFRKLNELIINEKLYLNPDFSRHDLLSISKLNKNIISEVLNQSGFNLKGYLNNLRIRHAMELIKAHPEYSIDAIVKNCGFKSLSTFYPVFKKITGITPAEYRDAILHLKKETKP